MIIDNLMSMCRDRFYKDICMNEDDDASELSHVLECFTSNNKRVLVFCLVKMGIDVLRKLLDNDDLKGCHLILIYIKDITSFSRKHLRACTKFTYELHSANFFKINPTAHELVPAHRKISDDEKQDLIRTIKSLDRLPKILKTDPISRWYRFLPGDVVEITRPTPIGSYVTVYRYCV